MNKLCKRLGFKMTKKIPLDDKQAYVKLKQFTSEMESKRREKEEELSKDRHSYSTLMKEKEILNVSP